MASRPCPPWAGGVHHPAVLRFVLAHDQDRALSGCAGRGPGGAGQRRHQVVLRFVVDGLGGVQPQPVQVELPDPVGGVVDGQRAGALGVQPVVVDGLPPLGLPVGEVVLREPVEVVPVGPEVVVDDVQDHRQPQPVGLGHEPAEVVGPAVAVVGGEQVHAVVAPAEVAGELGHRHHLQHGHPQLAQVGQPAGRALPGALGAEAADVQLVDDLPGQAHALPVAVVPGERRGIDHLRGAVGALGLEARVGIGQRLVVVVHQEAVAGAGAQAGAVGDPQPAGRRPHGQRLGWPRSLDQHRQLLPARAPTPGTARRRRSARRRASGRASPRICSAAFEAGSGAGLHGPTRCDSRAMRSGTRHHGWA